MKVWINNRIDEEVKIDDNELMKEFLNSGIRKATSEHWPLVRQLTTFLLDKHYTYESSDFNKLLDLVRKEEYV